jgi:hypothetical protein
MKTVTVEVQADHLQSLARVRQPLTAISELIWNGLDADADEVHVVFRKNDLEGLTGVIVRDDGNGLPYEEAESAFQKLGGSWKRTAQRTRKKGRILHGQLGKGRFKVFAIGTSVIWSTRYGANSHFSEYEISGSSSNIGTFNISDPKEANLSKSGTEVDIALAKNFPSLMGEDALHEIAEEFALYLLQYPDVKLVYDGERIDPTALFRNTATYELGIVEFPTGGSTTASLTVIEWNRSTDRALFLCDDSGVALHRVAAGIQAPRFDFTAYLKSPLVRQLDASGSLVLEEIDPELNTLIEAARTKLREHFRKRAAEESVDVVESWKSERIYPYEGDLRTSSKLRSDRSLMLLP